MEPSTSHALTPATGAGAGGTKEVPMEYKTLSNGVKMPMLGYGVFQIDDATTGAASRTPSRAATA